MSLMSPIFKFELEGLKANIHHYLKDHNDSLNKMVLDTLEEQLTEEWVTNEIQKAVKDCLSKAIKNIGDSYQLSTAITHCIEDKITESLNKKGSE